MTAPNPNAGSGETAQADKADKAMTAADAAKRVKRIVRVREPVLQGLGMLGGLTAAERQQHPEL